MFHAWVKDGAHLVPLAAGAPLERAVWIDLDRPDRDEVDTLARLGFVVPSPDAMEEIELSSRFYREGGVDYLTIVVPGDLPGGAQVSGPVTFIIGERQLVTVRHHAPRPFGTFPARAAHTSFGIADHRRIFLGLVEEITGRQADILEGIERGIDRVAATILGEEAATDNDSLKRALRTVGQEGETLARVRLGLLLSGRMLATFAAWSEARPDSAALRPFLHALQEDIQALEVHVDFLAGRLALVTDTTLGLVNVAQNTTVRMLSVVATLFLPPTLIASIYGMNFQNMPEVHTAWGYPVALVAMALSAAGSWAYFKRRGWW
ncbi:MAG: magnesium transporter [Rubellimicrobium sp.]|nr:magnesium transporter [Rubellimicrobium sp.]